MFKMLLGIPQAEFNQFVEKLTAGDAEDLRDFFHIVGILLKEIGNIVFLHLLSEVAERFFVLKVRYMTGRVAGIAETGDSYPPFSYSGRLPLPGR